MIFWRAVDGDSDMGFEARQEFRDFRCNERAVGDDIKAQFDASASDHEAGIASNGGDQFRYKKRLATEESDNEALTLRNVTEEHRKLLADTIQLGLFDRRTVGAVASGCAIGTSEIADLCDVDGEAANGVFDPAAF